MCDRIAHRGPDGYGEFFDGNVALGHRRLSIIDVSGGAQPMGNEDDTVTIVFNGEIYNYQELRKDLLGQGHRFRTRSDTETLIHLYEEVGERLPEFLNGMFAFAIWDSPRQKLFLARDYVGEKPLCYSESVPGLRFCFGSELKTLAGLPGFEPAVEARSVADFLAFGYVPDPQTIFRNVYKLPPGHSLTVTQDGTRLKKYWAPSFTLNPDADFEATVEAIDSLAADAVAKRMISDVPLGAFLSGGVDSGAAVAFMAEQSPSALKTFTIGFTNRAFDERAYARMVAERYHTEHYEQVVSPSIHDCLPTLVRHFDEPFADSSAIPTLYLSRMTREHVTVALSGDGADELFAGYRRYAHALIEERIRARFPDWFRRSFFRYAGRYYPKFDYLPQAFRAKSMLTNIAQDVGDAYFTSMTTFRDESLERALSPEMRQELGGYSARETYRQRFTAKRHLGPLEQMQAVDLETYLPGDILVKADRATMAYSLESRPPWLDPRLVELASTLPRSFKVRGARGKQIFKAVVRKRLPAQILDRCKMGFSVPLAEWFRTSLKPTFRTTVLQPGMHALLEEREVRRLWNEHQSGLHDHSRKLWSVLMLACWWQSFRKSDAAEPLAIASTPQTAAQAVP
jgi:asparagine synthase (glutamine-hydrolysing)